LNDFDLSIFIDELGSNDATPRIDAFRVVNLPRSAYEFKHDWLNLFLTCLMVWRQGLTLERSSVSASADSSVSSSGRLSGHEIDEKSSPPPSVSEALVSSWKRDDELSLLLHLLLPVHLLTTLRLHGIAAFARIRRYFGHRTLLSADECAEGNSV
jgi:hypothetical protein